MDFVNSKIEEKNDEENIKKNNMEEDRCYKINWKYAPIKAHYFFLFGGMGGILPYIQVYAKDFGISSTAVGIIYTIVPLFVCFSKPLFGFITDKLRNIKAILLALLVITALAFYSILYIPPISENEAVSMQVTSRCMEDPLELIIDPPSYDSACAKEITNKQLQCNFVSDYCIKNKSLPGTLNISNVLPFEKDVITLAFNFKFNKEIPSQENCQCLKHNSSTTLICQSNISECNIFNEIKTTSEYKLYNFWTFVLLAVIGGTGSATAFCLTDAACYEVLSDNPQLYGRQRLWATISWGIATLATGYFNDIASAGSTKTNYTPGFYLMLCFVGVDVLILCKVRLEKASMSTNICRDVRKIFSSWQTIIFSLGVYICGALTGLIWTYEFWYLTELGSSQLLLGLVAGVQCLIAEVPFFFFSGWFIKRFGHFYCLIASLTAFAMRVGLYSILENPWMVLPIDLLHGVTYAIFCAAMTLYAIDYAPPGTEATMLGILGGLFEGLGVATGSFLGGIGFDNMGGSWTFFVASMVSLVCVPFFTISFKIIKRSQGRLELDWDPTNYSTQITDYGTQTLGVETK